MVCSWILTGTERSKSGTRVGLTVLPGEIQLQFILKIVKEVSHDDFPIVANLGPQSLEAIVYHCY